MSKFYCSFCGMPMLEKTITLGGYNSWDGSENSYILYTCPKYEQPANIWEKIRRWWKGYHQQYANYPPSNYD